MNILSITRRAALAGSGMSLLAAGPLRAQTADPDRAMTGEALYKHVVHYTGLGAHRTGTAGDLATSDWIASRFRGAGLEVAKQPVPFRLFDVEACHVETPAGQLPGDPEYFPTPTPPGGVSARLRRLGPTEQLEALKGSIWLTETTEFSMVVPRALRARADAAGRAGAVAVVIVVASRSGELLGRGAIPPLGDAPWASVPIVGVAPKDAPALEAALARGEPVKVVVTGRDDPGAKAYNVIGRWRGEGGRPIVVTTPQSGMFRCGGERGGGIALLLGLAEWVGARRPRTPYLFTTNTGHEQAGRGAKLMQAELAPKPADVKAWLHLGSGIGSWDWRQGADGQLERYVRSPGAIRNFGAVPQLAPVMTRAFSHIPGLTSRSESYEGELRQFAEGGYPVFGFWGANLYHHTVADGPEQTAPELLEPIGLGLRRALLDLENSDRA